MAPTLSLSQPTNSFNLNNPISFDFKNQNEKQGSISPIKEYKESKEINQAADIVETISEIKRNLDI